MNDTRAATLQLHSRREVGLLLVLVASGIAYVLSEGARFGDAPVYVRLIMRGDLIDPGHLLWRPLGYVVGHALGTLDTFSSALWTLQGLCLAASLAGLVAIYFLCRQVAPQGIALFVTGFGALSNGYWAYAFSGCGYTCGVLFQAISLNFAIKEREANRGLRNAFAAGSLAGLAAATWATNVVVAPATLVALITTTDGWRMRVRHALNKACVFALGYVMTFALPVALVYLSNAGKLSLDPTASGFSFAQWLSSTRHGVPTHFGMAQLLRAALGWAQSVISLADLGYRLRLWHFGEGPLPRTPWSLALLGFYAGVLLLAAILLRGRSRLDTRSRWLIYAAVLAIGLNLAFGLAWQGTDLERYMPSLPFQMILLAVALNVVWQRADRAQFISLTFMTLLVLVVVNWQGTFKPAFDPNSFRNVWIRAISQHASRGDLIVFLGQQKTLVFSPRDENFPRVNEISVEILQGPGWRSYQTNAIRLTQSRGGRVFLGDSLFWLDSAPRDGWSFKENPAPTPREIHDTFLPFKSDTVAFTVGRERVWEARTDAGPAP
jgi:hypothetical protein